MKKMEDTTAALLRSKVFCLLFYSLVMIMTTATTITAITDGNNPQHSHNMITNDQALKHLHNNNNLHHHHHHLHHHNASLGFLHAHPNVHKVTQQQQLESHSCTHYRYNLTDFSGLSSLQLPSPSNHKHLFYRNLCYFPYEIVPGFPSTGSLFANTSMAVEATRRSQIKYYCNDTTTSFYYSHHIKNSLSSRIFDAKRLLTLLTDKTIVFYGDSTARQLFIDLEVELLPFQTGVIHYDQQFHTFVNASMTELVHAGIFYGMSRLYQTFNSTVFYCQNSRMGGIDSREAIFACNHVFETADYFVIAAGGWFRPYDGTDQDLPDYDASLTRRVSIFKDKIHSVRKYLSKVNPKVKVIWRLIPHAGNFEEHYYVNGKLRDERDYFYYGDWMRWDDVGLTSKWPLALNSVIYDLIEHEYPQDSILNLFTLSLQYIDYCHIRGYPVHADAVHYCPGGLLKSSLLLLEEIVEQNHNLRKE